MPKLATLKPWDRQPKESPRAFAAFEAYVGQGVERSARSVAKQLGKSGTLIHRWSKKHDWIQRVCALDAHLKSFQQAELEKLAKQGAVDWVARGESIRSREYEMAEALLAKAREMLEKLPKATMGDAVRAIELGFRLQRLSCGLPTDHTEHTGAVVVSDSQVIISIPDNGRTRAQVAESVKAVSQNTSPAPRIPENVGDNANGRRDSDPQPVNQA